MSLTPSRELLAIFASLLALGTFLGIRIERRWSQPLVHFTTREITTEMQTGVQGAALSGPAAVIAHAVSRGGGWYRPSSQSSRSLTLLYAEGPSGGFQPPSMTPESMRQAADALKTLKPDQIQQMLKEVEDMSPQERERLKSMGINPDMLKMSMKVMKANPNVIRMAQEQMSKMSPEQTKQASDLAQKQMEAMAPEELERMADSAIAGAGGPVDTVVDVEEDAPARKACDEALVDALFVVAAAVSKQPGAVTLEAFKQLPPIQSRPARKSTLHAVEPSR